MIWLILLLSTTLVESICIPGKYNNSGVCNDCPLGFYRDEYEEEVCKGCPTGQYQNEVSAYGCKKCQAGRYQDGVNQDSCKLCEIGKFQSQVGKPSCDTCLDIDMKHSTEKGATQCGGTTKNADESIGAVYLYCPSRCSHDEPCADDQTCVDGTCVDHTCELNKEAAGCICYGSVCNDYCMDNGDCVDMLENPDMADLVDAFNGVSQQD